MLVRELIENRQPKELPLHQMRVDGRGRRSSGAIRGLGIHSRAVSTVPDAICPSRAGLPQDLTARNTKLVSEASVNQPTLRSQDSEESGVRLDRLSYPIWSRRFVDAAAKHSSFFVVSAPWGKASRLTGPWVFDRNVRTQLRSPTTSSTSASPSESGEGRSWGRSARSSRRPGKPATWRRGAGIAWSLKARRN